jgi:hypothetical protein
MRVSRGILGFILASIIAPVGTAFAHAGGSTSGGGGEAYLGLNKIDDAKAA